MARITFSERLSIWMDATRLLLGGGQNPAEVRSSITEATTPEAWIDTYQQDRQVERLAIREFGLAPLRLALTRTATRPFGWE